MGQKCAQRLLIVRRDPSHAKTRERENLRHAANRNALLIKIDDRLAPAVLLRQVPIDLVAEHIRVHASGNLDDSPQQLPGHQRARRVVGVIDADELRVFIHKGFQLGKVGKVSVFLPQVHEPHVRADGLGDGVELLVGRHDAHHAVSRGDERAEHVIICARCAVRRNDLVRSETFIEPANSLAQGLASHNVAIGQPSCAEALQKCLLVLARERKQLVKRHRVHTCLSNIVPRAVFVRVHPFFHGKGFDFHTGAPY